MRILMEWARWALFSLDVLLVLAAFGIYIGWRQFMNGDRLFREVTHLFLGLTIAYILHGISLPFSLALRHHDIRIIVRLIAAIAVAVPLSRIAYATWIVRRVK